MAAMGNIRTLSFITNFLTLFLRNFAGGATVPESACEVYSKPGNLTLAGIFPFRRSAETFCNPGTTFWGLQLSEAMIWAIEEVNRGDLLPNLTIGYEIRDDCRTEDSALWSALSFFTDTCHLYQNKSGANFIGIIGGAFSSTSIFISKVANIYKIPFVSFSATSDELSDKERFPYFLRTLPPDRYQVGVFMDIILRYNWKYIALVYSADTYGISGARQIKSLAEENGVCLALSAAVQSYAPQNEIDEVIEKLARVPKAKVVIIFSLDDVANSLLKTVYRRKLNWDITWIASDGWGYESETEEWSSILVGSFFLRFRRPRAPAYEAYFRALNPSLRSGSPWYNEYWQDWKTEKECNDILQCPYAKATSGGPVIDAVNAFAYSLHNMLIDSCDKGRCLSPENFTGPALRQYLYDVKFNASAGPMEFDDFGDTLGKFVIQNLHKTVSGYQLVDAGIWDPRGVEIPLVINQSMLQFVGDSNEPPYSLCREKCKPGYTVVPLAEKCCSGCQKCPDHAIVVNVTSCKSCKPTLWPNENFTICKPIVAAAISLKHPIILAILFFSTIGLCLCMLTASGLWFYREHPLMKATSRELSAVNIVGLGIAFAGVLPLLLEPTKVSCMISEAFISLSFNMMFAPTFLKVTRIYRIFRAGKKSAQRPTFIGPRDQIGMVCLLILLQVVIILVFALVSPVLPVHLISTPPSNYIEMYCNFGLGLAFGIIYNFLIILGCCIFAFKARKVPSNYNESKFIGISVYSTLIVSLAAVPLYSTAVFVMQMVVTLCLVLLLNAYLTLICVYIPKLYAIRFVKDDGLNVEDWRTRSVVGGNNTISGLSNRTNRVGAIVE